MLVCLPGILLSLYFHSILLSCPLHSPSQPLPLPLNPKVLAVEVLPDKSFVFKSVLNPIKISLKTLSGEESSFIFKKGDDLRQDQLVEFHALNFQTIIS